MFATYNGQTVSITREWGDWTVDITYTDSDGVQRSKRVNVTEVDGYDPQLIDWDTVKFECKVQSYEEWDDFEFYDKDSETKRICVYYNRNAERWDGLVLFLDNRDDWTKEIDIPVEDVMRLKDLIPNKPVKEYETLFIVSERWDQYMSLEQEIFSNLEDALVFANKKVGDYSSDYFNCVDSEPKHEWYMWENTDEGVSIRLDPVQKDVRV